MPDGNQVLDTDGYRSVLASGNRAVKDSSDQCAECCGSCTASATTCGSCWAGDTPTQYQVVFSGVNLCTACHLNDVIGQNVRFSWSTSDVLNTTHTLTQTSACKWRKLIASAVHADFYTETDGSTCSTLDFDLTNDLEMILEKTASDTWKLIVEGGGSLVLYYDEFTGDGPGVCETVPTSSNEHTASSECGDTATGGISPSPSKGGYGGSATITCL